MTNTVRIENIMSRINAISPTEIVKPGDEPKGLELKIGLIVGECKKLMKDIVADELGIKIEQGPKTGVGLCKQIQEHLETLMHYGTQPTAMHAENILRVFNATLGDLTFPEVGEHFNE